MCSIVGPTSLFHLTFFVNVFSLMATEADNVFASSLIMESVTYGAQPDFNQQSLFSQSKNSSYSQAIADAAQQCQNLLEMKKIPSEGEAKRHALFGGNFGKLGSDSSPEDSALSQNQHYSIHFSFSGFLFSLVDSSPSEIATITINNLNALARWNSSRSEDASFLLSVGWAQIDNHVPSAPFPVALCPDEIVRDDKDLSGTSGKNDSPLLVVGVELAPQHSSGIVVSFLLLKLSILMLRRSHKI